MPKDSTFIIYTLQLMTTGSFCMMMRFENLGYTYTYSLIGKSICKPIIALMLLLLKAHFSKYTRIFFSSVKYEPNPYVKARK